MVSTEGTAKEELKNWQIVLIFFLTLFGVVNIFIDDRRYYHPFWLAIAMNNKLTF